MHCFHTFESLLLLFFSIVGVSSSGVAAAYSGLSVFTGVWCCNKTVPVRHSFPTFCQIIQQIMCIVDIPLNPFSCLCSLSPMSRPEWSPCAADGGFLWCAADGVFLEGCRAAKMSSSKKRMAKRISPISQILALGKIRNRHFWGKQNQSHMIVINLIERRNGWTVSMTNKKDRLAHKHKSTRNHYHFKNRLLNSLFEKNKIKFQLLPVI